MREGYAETEYQRNRKNADSVYFLRLTNLLSILGRNMSGGEIEERARAAVRALRARKGWTQGELADALRQYLPADRQSWAKQANVSKFEIGTVDADVNTLHAFAQALGVQFSKLFPDQPLPELTPVQVEAAEVAALWPSVPQDVRVNVLGLLRALRTSRGSGQTDSPAGAPVKPRTAARERQGGR